MASSSTEQATPTQDAQVLPGSAATMTGATGPAPRPRVQALPGCPLTTSSLQFETLKNMNATTGKYATPPVASPASHVRSTARPSTVAGFAPIYQEEIPPEWLASVKTSAEYNRKLLRRLRKGVPRQCANCGAVESESPFKKCGGCRLAPYCSHACQWRHWRSSHRDVCSSTMPSLRHDVAVEVPDFPIFRQYMRFLHTCRSDGLVGVMMSSREQWAKRREQLRQTIASLLGTGRPSLVWVRVTSMSNDTPSSLHTT